jgi:hypothetical protein
MHLEERSSNMQAPYWMRSLLRSAALNGQQSLIIIKNQYRFAIIGNTSLTASECQQFIHGRRHFSPPMTLLTLIYTNN